MSITLPLLRCLVYAVTVHRWCLLLHSKRPVLLPVLHLSLSEMCHLFLLIQTSLIENKIVSILNWFLDYIFYENRCKESCPSLLTLSTHNCKQKCFLTGQRSLLLSLSAGQDSISMVFVMKQLERQWRSMYGISLCNHLWQSASFYTVLHSAKVSFLTGKPLSFILASYSLKE